jgi:hypothetical protein
MTQVWYIDPASTAATAATAATATLLLVLLLRLLRLLDGPTQATYVTCRLESPHWSNAAYVDVYRIRMCAHVYVIYIHFIYIYIYIHA